MLEDEEDRVPAERLQELGKPMFVSRRWRVCLNESHSMTVVQHYRSGDECEVSRHCRVIFGVSSHFVEQCSYRQVDLHVTRRAMLQAEI